MMNSLQQILGLHKKRYIMKYTYFMGKDFAFVNNQKDLTDVQFFLLSQKILPGTMQGKCKLPYTSQENFSLNK